MKTGHQGPSQAECDSAYGSSGIVEVVNGFQKLSIEESGFYSITAQGACGGTFNEKVPGYAAIASSTHYFDSGDELLMVVGQIGSSNPNCGDFGSGGGGGKF